MSFLRVLFYNLNYSYIVEIHKFYFNYPIFAPALELQVRSTSLIFF